MIAGSPRRRAIAPISAAANSTRPSSSSGVASVTARGYAPAVPGRVDVFRIPTRIQLGRGVALTLAEPLRQVGAKKVLLVTDAGVMRAGLVAPLEEKLRDAKIPYEIYDEVVPDPGVGEVQRAYERAKAYGADAFVAVGGGSSIDTAKMAATLLTNGGTLPPFGTAITGMDTRVHAIESFVNKNTYRMTEVLALEAIRDVGRALPRAVKDGSDMQAREEMMRAVISASLAFSNTRLGNVHAMALPLGGWAHVAHGTAVAILLPHVMDFNRGAAEEKYAAVGEALGVAKDSRAAVKRVFDLNREIGIPGGLAKVGVSAELIPNMTKDTMLSGNIAVNPRTTTAADIDALFRAAM